MDIQGFRAQYPEYNDVSDTELSDSLYTKHYADLPREEFDKAFMTTKKPTTDSILGNIAIGAAKGLVHIGAKYGSRAEEELGFPWSADPMTATREEVAKRQQGSLETSLGVADAPEAEGLVAKVARGAGEAIPQIGELVALGAVASPILGPASAAATKLPGIVGKYAPHVVESAGTFGLQGALEPSDAAEHAKTGAAVGTAFGLLGPYGKTAKVIGGAAIGTGQEALTNPNATTEDYARSAIVMGGLGLLGRGARKEGKVKVTAEDFATEVPGQAEINDVAMERFKDSTYKSPIWQAQQRQEEINRTWAAENPTETPVGTPQPQPATVPTGGPELTATARIPADLPKPELGESSGQETGGRVPPSLTDHPVQLALREVYGDQGTARMEADRFEGQMGGKVNMHPVYVPGVGWQLRLGQEPSVLGPEYTAYLDELNGPKATKWDSDPQAVEWMKITAEQNRVKQEAAEGGVSPDASKLVENFKQGLEVPKDLSQEVLGYNKFGGEVTQAMVDKATVDMMKGLSVDKDQITAVTKEPPNATLGTEGTYAQQMKKVQDVTPSQDANYKEAIKAARFMGERSGEPWRPVKRNGEWVIEPIKEIKETKGVKLYSLGPDVLWDGVKSIFGSDKMPGGGILDRVERGYWKTVGTPFWKKMQSPEFRAYYNTAADRREKVINPVVEKMNRVRDPWKKMSSEEQATARDILWSIEGRKLAATKAPEIEAFDNNGVRNVRPVLEHLQQFKGWLEAKGASPNVVEFLTKKKEIMVEAFSEHYNYLANRKDVDLTIIQDLYNNVGMISNYHPHMFYGKSYIEGYDTEGNLIARVPVPKSLDLAGRILGQVPKLSKFKENLENDPALKGLKWGEVKDAAENERYWINSPVPIDILSRLLDESAAKIEADPKLAEMAKAFRGSLQQETVQFLKTRGFSNFAQRKGILGFEKNDVMGTTFDYLQGMYGGLAKMDAAKNYTKLLFESMPNASDHKLLTDFIQDDLGPSSSWERITDKVRMGLYIRYLGGRLKSAAVNLTNMPVASAPIMFANVKGVNGLHLSAAKDVASQYAKEVGVHRQASGIKGLPEGNTLSAPELKFMTEFSDSVLQAQQMNEFKGERDKTGLMYKVSDVLGLPMEMTEWYMRSVTGLAALRAVAEGKVVNERILKENGWKQGEKIDLTNPEQYGKASEFASNIISQAYGDYTSYNKPALIRHSPTLKTAYTFRFYNQHLMEMWNHYLRGNEGTRGQIAAMASMTAQGVLGGLKSMPLAAALMGMYKAYSKGEFETTAREAYPDKQLAMDAAFEGMPSLAGVTIGSSLDVGFPSSIKEAIGIPAAVADDIYKGYKAWESGNPWRAAEYMVPLVAIRDILSGYRESASGQRTIGGAPIAAPGEIEPATLTTSEAVVKMLGFQPTSREKLGRVRSEMADLVEYKKNSQAQLADRYTNAVVSGDYGKAASILDDVIAWNMLAAEQNKPELMISKENLNAALKARMEPKHLSNQMLGRGLGLKEGYGVGR